MLDAYVTIGILILVIILLVVAAVLPRLKKYQLVVKRIEPKKRTFLGSLAPTNDRLTPQAGSGMLHGTKR